MAQRDEVQDEGKTFEDDGYVCVCIYVYVRKYGTMSNYEPATGGERRGGECININAKRTYLRLAVYWRLVA